MGSRNRKPKISSKPQIEVPTTKVNNGNAKLIFSFEYLDLNNSKYSMDNIGDNRTTIQFYKELHKKMHEYSQTENFRKMISENGRYRDRNHIHKIDWTDNKIHENCFTSLPKNLMQQVKDECWQLGINSTTFRIHGFFIENVFYVVWLDPLHKLYSSK